MTSLKIKIDNGLPPIDVPGLLSGTDSGRTNIEILIDGPTGQVDRINFKQPLKSFFPNL